MCDVFSSDRVRVDNTHTHTHKKATPLTHMTAVTSDPVIFFIEGGLLSGDDGGTMQRRWLQWTKLVENLWRLLKILKKNFVEHFTCFILCVF